MRVTMYTRYTDLIINAILEPWAGQPITSSTNKENCPSYI